MPRQPIDLPQKIREILGHVQPMPVEAETPLPHYRRSATDTWNLLQYVERNLAQLNLYPAVVQRHMSRLHSMILVGLIEAFERYLKEIAGVCVDGLAHFVLDNRFNRFRVTGSALAAHFGTASLGKSLCESATWLNCEEVNDRFKDLLATPFRKGDFLLFPRKPAREAERYDTLNTIWQLRHSVVHNVGVITRSDAIKLQLLAKLPVAAPRLLSPRRDDLRYLRRFLDETAERANERIGLRLAEVLTAIYAANPSLFSSQAVANSVSRQFGSAVSVGGVAGAVSAP